MHNLPIFIVPVICKKPLAKQYLLTNLSIQYRTLFILFYNVLLLFSIVIERIVSRGEGGNMSASMTRARQLRNTCSSAVCQQQSRTAPVAIAVLHQSCLHS